MVMFTKIFVPLDGSALADRAVPYARTIARAVGAQLTLFYARPKLLMTGEQPFDVDAAAGKLRAEGMDVETAVFPLYHEPIGEVILETAREKGADLVVMSTHGRGGLGRWLYGSAADQVLRKAELPIVLVPAACERTWESDGSFRMLVPLDGSPLAEEVLKPARELAGAMRAEVVLLRVVERSQEMVRARAYAAINSGREVDRAREYLEGIASHFATVSKSVDTFTETGLPTPTIAKVARNENVDLVVMASHGYGGLARVVLGSVTTRVLQRAETPLLVVRPTPVRHSVPASPPLTAVPQEEEEPVGPPITITLSPREANMTRTALKMYLLSTDREEHLAAPLHALLNKLPESESAVPISAAERSVTN
jgi:nucleotide-binding universal stress UspA family protein